jgi:hypothetical protein
MDKQILGILLALLGGFFIFYSSKYKATGKWDKYYRNKGFYAGILFMFIGICYFLGWA